MWGKEVVLILFCISVFLLSWKVLCVLVFCRVEGGGKEVVLILLVYWALVLCW